MTAFVLSVSTAQQKPRTSAKAASGKPNIILVMVDDLGYSDFGAYGSEINTPTIDKLAGEGLRLREFYNNSICAPMCTSLITGQHPHKFDHFYGILGGAFNYFDADPLPIGRPASVTVLEDNKRQPPKFNSFYFTDEVTNHAVTFLGEQIYRLKKGIGY